ncbi:MAG: hypothetical protein ACFFAO_09775 [Candidatus Hermodarchaeota archaeon]
MMTDEIETKKKTIEELNPFDKQIDVTFKIINKGEITAITSKRTGETHNLCNITVADTTGAITLTLWSNDIDLVEEDKVYVLSNGYVNVHRNSMRLSKGKYGLITSSDEEIDEVDLSNNLSDKFVEGRRRRRPQYGYGYNNYQYGSYQRGRNRYRYDQEQDNQSYRW